MTVLKSHCDNGHEFTPENTYWRPNGFRACRGCIRAAVARYKTKPHIRPPGQEQAWKRLEYLRRRGRLKAQPCAECGRTPAHAHHPRGYLGDAALDIVWLCPTHHYAVHHRAA